MRVNVLRNQKMFRKIIGKLEDIKNEFNGLWLYARYDT